MIDDSIIIRPLEKGDRALVVDFFSKSRMGHESRMFFNRRNGNLNRALKFFDDTLENHVNWIAFDGERMVGYVFLWDIDKSVVWFGIAVSDDYKGQGLGTRLTQTAIEYAKANGKGGILLTTHIANFRGQALYEKCGFVQIGTDDRGELLYLLRF